MRAHIWVSFAVKVEAVDACVFSGNHWCLATMSCLRGPLSAPKITCLLFAKQEDTPLLSKHLGFKMGNEEASCNNGVVTGTETSGELCPHSF